MQIKVELKLDSFGNIDIRQKFVYSHDERLILSDACISRIFIQIEDIRRTISNGLDDARNTVSEADLKAMLQE